MIIIDDGTPPGCCTQCAGDGKIVLAAHDCDGSEQMCIQRCPAAIEVRCPGCDGTGKLENQVLNSLSVPEPDITF